tara:strand:- start:4297 stop:4785 length:489 start_codon:yes stop_codon:yes gene_type:complete
MVATVRYINVNPNGGVPKLQVTSAKIDKLGIKEDYRHRGNDKIKNHGGIDRAILIYDYQKIIKLQADGHPIAPGTVGENITIDFWREGLSYDQFKSGDRLKIGEAILELTFTAPPCSVIGKSFKDGNYKLVDEKRNPTFGRWCAKVVEEAQISIGDIVEIIK